MIPDVLDQNKTLFFTNSTSDDFTHTFNNNPFTIKAGQTLQLPEHLVYLFAKHLAVRELNRRFSDGVGINDLTIDAEMARFIGKEGIKVTSPEALNVAMQEIKQETKQEIKEEPKVELPIPPKRMGRPPKVKPIDEV